MRCLVFGCGTIGPKHIKALQGLGVEASAYDPDPRRLASVEAQFGVETFKDIEEALDSAPDAVLICTPTHTHVPLAVQAARRGIHLFVEKPVSHDPAGLAELERLVQEKGLITLVGCNLRFMQSLRQARDCVAEGVVGRVLSVRAQCGFYLPNWAPTVDYRTRYNAKPEEGGGIILDAIHELDYLRWMFGDVEEVFAFAGTVSALEIRSEDLAEILLRFHGGPVAALHLDYLQRTYRRNLEIIGEDGILVWDFMERTLKIYKQAADRWETHQESLYIQREQMLADELRHFLRCLEGQERPCNDLAFARKTLEVALASKRSARERAVVRLGAVS